MLNVGEGKEFAMAKDRPGADGLVALLLSPIAAVAVALMMAGRMVVLPFLALGSLFKWMSNNTPDA